MEHNPNAEAATEHVENIEKAENVQPADNTGGAAEVSSITASDILQLGIDLKATVPVEHTVSEKDLGPSTDDKQSAKETVTAEAPPSPKAGLCHHAMDNNNPTGKAGSTDECAIYISEDEDDSKAAYRANLKDADTQTAPSGENVANKPHEELQKDKEAITLKEALNNAGGKGNDGNLASENEKME